MIEFSTLCGHRCHETGHSYQRQKDKNHCMKKLTASIESKTQRYPSQYRTSPTIFCDWTRAEFAFVPPNAFGCNAMDRESMEGIRDRFRMDSCGFGRSTNVITVTYRTVQASTVVYTVRTTEGVRRVQETQNINIGPKLEVGEIFSAAITRNMRCVFSHRQARRRDIFGTDNPI